jgi:tetrahydromethanopterin S-methyltransferase subunit H
MQGEEMFTFDTEQRVCEIRGIKIGGQPGENPPLLIASMFHNKDRILEDRKGNFDRKRAKELIKRQEELSEATGIPAMVAMVANTPEEAKIYIDFFLETTDMPFGIDMWVAEKRARATEYVAELGVQEKFLYNSITPWDKDIKGQVARLKDLGIRHVIVQAFDDTDQTPAGRLKSLESLLAQGAGDFDTVIVDTSVMNLPSTSFSLLANRLIKERLGPTQTAPICGRRPGRRGGLTGSGQWTRWHRECPRPSGATLISTGPSLRRRGSSRPLPRRTFCSPPSYMTRAGRYRKTKASPSGSIFPISSRN